MRRIGWVVYPGFQIMSLSTITVVEMANRVYGAPVYEIVLASEHGGPVATSIGPTIDTSPLGATDYDTVIMGAPANIGPAERRGGSWRTARAPSS